MQGSLGQKYTAGGQAEQTKVGSRPGERRGAPPVGKGRPARPGKPGGALHGWHPVDLLAHAFEGVLARVGRTAADLAPNELDDVLVGCVGQASEQAVNVARNAALAAGLPEAIPAATIDRQCGSSQQALQFASQAIRAGDADLVLGGGVESMSRVPMFSAAKGADPYGRRVAARYEGGLVPQGISAELIAARWGLTRADLDAFAAESHHRAAAAADAGLLAAELVSTRIDQGEGPTGETLERDEGVRPGTTADTLAALDPVFRDDAWSARFPEIGWVIHAGNASQLSDGAGAVLVASRERAEAEGWTPLARIRASVAVGADPILNLMGVVPATQRALGRAGMTLADLDLIEVNEAFAPVVLAWAAETGADLARVNVRGGAIANGHPLGASGTKLTATLLHAMQERGATTGLQVMCEGGGMANATVFERG